MIRAFVLFVLVGAFGLANAQQPPPNFFFHKDALIDAMRTTWPTNPIPAAIPGLIEKESCISLSHSLCWSRRAELKTARENGVGLGQITRAYTATGAIRFDAMDEARALDSRLRNWTWEDRYNAKNQMIAINAMMRRNYGGFKMMETDIDRMAISLAAYNGGIGGMQSDQRICRNAGGCNPNLWFGHTERYSLKAKTAVTGYGKSFFEINRQYPRDILFNRMKKYEPHINHGVLLNHSTSARTQYEDSQPRGVNSTPTSKSPMK